MKHFRYKLGIGVKICIMIVSAIWIAAATFSFLKLLNKSIYVSISPALDVVTIVFAVLCISALIMLYYMNYQIADDGIKLKFGFFTLFRKKFKFSNIKAIVYKSNKRQLFICGDIKDGNAFGTAIIISPDLFKEFVLQIKNKGVEFDYIEDDD